MQITIDTANAVTVVRLEGELTQAQREKVMTAIKSGLLRLMVATDVAARGIDIEDLSHVINYSVPETGGVYVHRTGRTGRIGKTGTALTLVGLKDLPRFSCIIFQVTLGKSNNIIIKHGEGTIFTKIGFNGDLSMCKGTDDQTAVGIAVRFHQIKITNL